MFNLKYHKNVTQGLEKPIFPLVSKRHLASLLGYDYNYLASMAAKVGRFYKPSDIKYPSGKMRHIDKPMGALRYIQDRILKNILETVEFPKTMLGGIKGRSIRQNAEYHVNQPVVVTLDLRDCFPTINNKRVYSIYRKLGCSSQIARVLTQLTTFQHRLPQGAPTSSILANLALLPLHNDILQLTNSLGLKSTIYIDDITISGTQAQETIGQIIDLIHTHGYFVSRKKISCRFANQRQEVTGIVVNRKISIPKQKITNIRQQILSLSDADPLPNHKLMSLQGKIAYVKTISPNSGKYLENLANKLLSDKAIELTYPDTKKVLLVTQLNIINTRKLIKLKSFSSTYYLGGNMAYRNKTYICFDADTDMHYYRLMQAWKQSGNIEFDFYNAHDLNNLMQTSLEETIKTKLKERLRNTKVFVLLIGKNTKNLYKFVRWEIEVALKMDLPIIAVNLNGKRQQDSDLCPPIIRDELAIHISFNAAILQYALEHWIERHAVLRKEGASGSRFYPDSIYTSLEL